MINVSALVCSVVTCTLTFRLLHRLVPRIEEPHFLLTIFLTVYLYVASQGDALVPNLPVLNRVVPEGSNASLRGL